MNRKTVEHKNYSIEIYSGTVLDFNQQSSTSVSGSGSYGHVTIKSDVDRSIRFFLIDEQGKEKDFQIHNWDFPMRIGHDLTVFAAFPKKEGKSGFIIALKNSNINERSINNLSIKQFSKSLYAPFLWLSVLLFLFPIVFIFVMMWLDFSLSENINILWNLIFYSCIGSLIFYHIRWRWINYKLKKEIKQLI